jgi:glycosyltransferase involved in cell wall biosynthesis
MKISLNCKLDSAGAYGFIKPIADINEIKQIDVFRDSNALPCEKVKYHHAINRKNGLLSQISKFFKMLFVVNKEHRLAIGIYEIPHGLLAFLIGKLRKIPVVISIIGNPGYKVVRKGLRKKITYFMYKRIMAITVTGSKSKQFLIRNGIDPDKIFILPNSIDVNMFRQDELAKKQFDIISIGRLSPEKELGSLVEIVLKLKQIKPNIKAGIAGKGPAKENILATIKKLNLEENVFLLGYVDNIAEFYNSGKVFVLTSRTEGLPRTVIEAMSCGIPCVASNVGDMEDLIDDKKNGFIVNDYQDVAEYVNKIRLLLEQKEKYTKISKAAQAEVKNCYSYEAATKVWKEIIQKVEIDK